ncbi:MAG: hypothetical protein ACPL4H_04440, partial [Anaerolineales bacterium]
MKAPIINRREFLKISGYGIAGLLFGYKMRVLAEEPFPQGEKLGRVFSMVELKSRPDIDAQTVGVLYDDAVVVWQKEVVGRHPYRYKQRFVETPQGYIWSSDLQPCENKINQPVEKLPDSSQGPGMWVEVTIPWVDIVLEREPISPGFKIRSEQG